MRLNPTKVYPIEPGLHIWKDAGWIKGLTCCQHLIQHRDHREKQRPAVKFNAKVPKHGRSFMHHLAITLRRLIRLFLLCAIISGGQTYGLAGETVRINGSGTALEIMKPLIRAYTEFNPTVSFVMEKPLGSSGAIKALIAGALDIAVSSRALKPEEAAQGFKSNHFGKTPLAIVTGSNVPLKDISTEELAAIYSGRTRKWPNNENIRVILRPLEDIDTKILRGLSPAMDEAVTQAQSQRGMITAVTDTESDQMVANTIGSIGTSGLAGIMVEKTPLTILSLNGVMPAIESMAEGRYPLAKEMNFVTPNRLSDSAQKFLEFIYSANGRNIVEKVSVLTAVGDQ
jgi:phosphate transport system substrate-binding protein